MHFKSWYKLNEAISFYGWLDPNGEFHDLISNLSHGTWATKVTGLPYPQGMHKLWQDGWQRMTQYGDEVSAHNPAKAPNPKQLRELKNRAIENNIRRILYDNEGTDRVIWHAEYD